MKLVEGVAGYLPMVLLVHLTKHDGIRENLVQITRAFKPDIFFQGGRQMDDGSELLDDLATLAEQRLRFGSTGLMSGGCLCHIRLDASSLEFEDLFFFGFGRLVYFRYLTIRQFLDGI